MSEPYDAQRRLLVIALAELIARQEIPKGFWDAIEFRSHYVDLPEHYGGVDGMRAALESSFAVYRPRRELPTLPSEARLPENEKLLLSAAADIHSDGLNDFDWALDKVGSSWTDADGVREHLRHALVSYVVSKDQSLEPIL